MEARGAGAFAVSGASYDAFMGRWSSQLAEPFADAAGVVPGTTALDVGCGTGTLTGLLVSRLGAGAVQACDPSASLRDACAARYPGVDVRLAAAESLPFGDAVVDRALAQLVLPFVADARKAASEMARVTRPGGTVAACVWDYGGGMEMLRAFWDAATSTDPDAPDEARTLPFGRPGEIVALFEAVGLADVVESVLTVSSAYGSFDELWDGFLAGVGPAGAYCVSLGEQQRERLRAALFARCGAPSGPLVLSARARCAVGRVPG